MRPYTVFLDVFVDIFLNDFSNDFSKTFQMSANIIFDNDDS